MEYKARPAWRNQWAAFLVAAFFLVLFAGTIVAAQQPDAPAEVWLGA